MKKILVTGGAGYIGSHTAVELHQEGFEVVIVDNLVNSSKSAIDGISAIIGTQATFIEADCCDSEAMGKLFAEHNFDGVIHFAALKAVGESVSMPLEYYNNNLGSLMGIITAMRKSQCENLIFSSSCTVYGQSDELPVKESTPRKEATSPYGNSKAMCEDIIRDSVRAYEKFNAISLRYFNPIGAHPSALIGELPIGVPNNLVPFITQTAAGLRKELSIFGNDYNTADGTCLRDYIDVTDLAKAHVAAARRMIEGESKCGYEIFNIGTGRPLSVLELVETFQSVNSVTLPYCYAPRRDGDIEKVWGDISLVESELGWRAERSIEETLHSAWQWEKKIRNI